ncbi:hypothetical protein AWH69_02095 [Janibacter melonis]|uniref:WXG100 family type VII secretion target n=2 Tax=Janibacter melonis TaxID=262209 RepID=A0A176QFN4_9MICO|nr:WXG100 family type VII secretion target [Janibacter melonis]MBD5831902.1 hypothetical protein [Janibacter melonis]OAB88615.1 hypothetical protein AWH69_02095 [Janibacter melonis]
MGGNLTEGMDTDRIREVAGQLQTQAGKIGEVQQNGTSQQGTLAENWLGSDSEAFGQAWQQASKALQQASDAITAYSKAALDQATQQDEASKGR